MPPEDLGGTPADVDMMPAGMTPDWVDSWNIRQLIEGKIVVDLPFSRNGKTQYVFDDQPGLWELLTALLESLSRPPSDTA